MIRNKKAVIVQCRLSSTRLPEKAIKELGGKTVLDWVLASMKKVRANKYYVATDSESYKIIKPICDANGFDCFAGDLNNVLKRFCDLIKKIKVNTIIRATADNPFLFYEAAQASLDEFEKKNKYRKTCDYLTYTGLPHGSGVEIIDASSLLEAAELTDSSFDQEHVGPALYNHKERFNCEFITAPSRFNFPNLRTTIDTYSDYLRAISIVNYVSGDKKKIKEPYTTEQILEALDSNKIKNPVIFYPSTSKGHGTGHLHRCLKCAIETDSYIYIPSDYTLEETSDIIKSYIKKGLKEYQVINELPDETFSPVIVTDLFSLERKDMIKLSKYKSIIALDEGSKNSDFCDYLLDVIPSYDLTRQANFNDPCFISKPLNVRKNKPSSFKNILVCIGGEDPANLTENAALILNQIYPDAKISAITKKDNLISEIVNIRFIPPVEDLKEHLYEYDLVVTHYGLTAFEAAYAGCALLMLSSTKLHEKLAQKYEYAFVPFGKLNYKTVKSVLENSNLYPKKKLGETEKSLGIYISGISNGHRINCPICQRQDFEPDPIISRNATRTYRRCKSCGIIYMSWSSEAEKLYKKSYFFEDYKKQYGKTYQEDFDSIKAQCLKRVNVISSLIKTSKGKNILDIGCAYGPFLAAAGEKNYNPFGTDISSEAIDFVKNELHFPASQAAFPQIDTTDEFGVSQFDAVTMWYVIEHFKNLDVVLKKVNAVLKKDGIFAFSTPSGQGVSATTNKDNFYVASPTDHYSIWEPSIANKILKPYGFKVVKIVSTGHHPERFPQIKKSGAQKGSIQWNTILKYSEAKKLGDTVEIYCKKIKEL
ncbi:MAG: methyltransferase domain-containing protein [Treponema sp.]|nr:methyltransferase domain-containing protein [Treponema sp.]